MTTPRNPARVHHAQRGLYFVLCDTCDRTLQIQGLSARKRARLVANEHNRMHKEGRQ